MQEPILVSITPEEEDFTLVWTPPSQEELVGKEQPTFELKELSYMGLLEVSFSQQMILQSNLTEIDDSVFELEVLLDPSNDI